jgi:hypothetical protein
MTSCPSCRRPLPLGARHCSNCGYQIPVTVDELVDRYWILEAGSLPGVAPGAELRVVLRDQSLELFGLHGRVASMSLADTKFEREPGGSIVARNSPDGYDLTLSEPAEDAAVRRANSNPVVQMLSGASNGWTAPAVLRQYKNDEGGHAAFAKEVSIFGQHNYTPMTQSADGGHIHVGRLLLTGGLARIHRTSSSDGSMTAAGRRSTQIQITTRF